MTDNITTIKDPSIRIKPSDKLVQYLKENSKELNKNKNQVPDRIKNLTKNKKINLKTSDVEWLNEFLIKERNNEEELLTGKELDEKIKQILDDKNYDGFDAREYLEEKNSNKPYLHELMNGSKLILPENEVVERNPILAERIEKLKKEQEEREYKEMTKNVDTSKKFIAEDTVSYQLNMMNRHLIAVAQFIISVGAGFAFGFLGIELIVENLSFGGRLLLGIACALVIAIAEFYFLAKHLNEDDKEGTKDKAKVTEATTSAPPKSRSKAKGKLHKD